MLKTKFKQTEIGEIPEDWDLFAINDVAEIVGGGTPSTKEPSNFGGDIPWITPKDLSNYSFRYISRGERNITRRGLEESNAKLLPPNTVLLTTRAPVGYVAIAKNEVATNQGFRSLISRQNVSSEYLYYLLKINTERLKSNASGTTFGELSGSTLKSLKFPFPQIEEQRAIAKILSDLDEKIEINHQMNKTLESIAQAIFKRWFVDFEFPGYEKTKFVNGLPEGWRICATSEILEIQYGKDIRTTELLSEGYPVYGGNGIIGYYDKYLFEIPRVIVSCRGAASGKILLTRPKSFVTHNSLVMNVKEIQSGIDYHYLKRCCENSDISVFVTGSAQPQITIDHLNRLEILFPNERTLRIFSQIAGSIDDLMYKNELEIENLAKIRDSLLPRLMSGKIRVAH